jgi:hypothetical protein
MNFISDVLSEKPASRISVFTSVNFSPYENQKYEDVRIWRLGSVSENSILRYASYLSYNLFATISLLINRPDVVVVYETLSIFPAFVFSSVFKKKKIHVHYHEYTSIPEKLNASRYMKYLFWCEGKLLHKITCSQTNEDRKALFLKDNPKVQSNYVFVFPNLPPANWWSAYGQLKTPWREGKIKLVHVGVLDADTMFLEQILLWVQKHPDELELTIFSQTISRSAQQLIDKYRSSNIKIKSPIRYYDLPKKLIQYDIGLVLYNGHIPNYIYSVPNKVYEYISCGVKVVSVGNLFTLKKTFQHDILFLDISNLNSRSIIDLRHHLSFPSFYSFENTPNLSSLVN